MKNELYKRQLPSEMCVNTTS